MTNTTVFFALLSHFCFSLSSVFTLLLFPLFNNVSRVEAMQLGDCGQEVALISKLTEGSRVFLSREESQHFIKE